MSKKPRLMIFDGPEIAGRLVFVKRLGTRFEVVVAGASQSAATTYENADITYVYIPVHRGANPFKDLFLLFRLYRVVRRWRPDIVQTFGSKLSVWGRLAGVIGGANAVCGTITGLGALYSGNSLRKRMFRVFFDSLQRVTSRLSGLTVFQNSRDMNEMLAKNVVSRDKAKLISGSGVDTEAYSPEVRSRRRESARAELGVGSEEVLVLMVSRVIRTKGVIEFAQASKSLSSKAKFILVGPRDGTNIDSLSESELQMVENEVNYLGVQTDVPKWLSAADVFVLPTLYREGVPRVVLEAAAMGLPIVTSKEGAGDSAVVHGENGLIVDPDDQSDLERQIETLIDSESLRTSYGRKSRAIAETELSVDLIADHYADAYSTLLAG